ncbi:MAG TPA: TonB family protein [Phenylobacterium sp.]|jgi:TonB family protein|nr:TonB family protein [Phenylobacterium sp.]
MIEAILSALARANLAAAAAILLVLLARKPARQMLGARAAYGLWLIPVLAVLAVFAPHPAAPLPSAPALIAPFADTATQMAVVVTAEAPRAMSLVPNLTTVLFVLWLVGVLAASGLLLHRQSRFVVSLGRLEPVPDAKPRRLRAEHAGVGPAVVGAFRPRIVTPSDFETRFAAEERDVVLAHEAVHLANGDARINALAAALQCLAWFNPLVHLGVHALRIDQELACDATVLSRFPSARRLYAEVLLKTQLATQPLPLGCHWPARAAHPLKERIVMLKSPLPSRSRRIAGAVAIGAISLAGAAAAWAAQPAAPATLASPSSATIPGDSDLEPEQARKLAGPNGDYLCKPDANRELHHCRITHGTPWARVATVADVMREYPPQARKSGLTADVLVKCATNRDSNQFEGCAAVTVESPSDRSLSPSSRKAFGDAAIRVLGTYRLKNGGVAPDFTLPSPGYYTIRFSEHPLMPGGPKPEQVTTRAPKELPIPAEAKVVTSPNWAETPAPADFARAYPAKADQDALGGMVTLDCLFAADGRLTACRVASETPPEDGFGAAALKVSSLFRAKLTSLDGTAVAGGRVRIPIRFMAPGRAEDFPTGPTFLVTQPVWTRKPSVADFTRFYPASAAKLGLTANVNLICFIGADGTLPRCGVAKALVDGVPASPGGVEQDFGTATLELAKLFQMEITTRDRMQVAGGLVKIPVRWAPPAQPAAQP